MSKIVKERISWKVFIEYQHYWQVQWKIQSEQMPGITSLPKYFSSFIWSLPCCTLYIVIRLLPHYLSNRMNLSLCSRNVKRLFSPLWHKPEKFHGYAVLRWKRSNLIHLSIFIIKIILLESSKSNTPYFIFIYTHKYIYSYKIYEYIHMHKLY